MKDSLRTLCLFCVHVDVSGHKNTTSSSDQTKKKANAGALFRPSKDPTTVIRAIKIREEKEIPALKERQKKVTATR